MENMKKVLILIISITVLSSGCSWFSKSEKKDDDKNKSGKAVVKKEELPSVENLYREAMYEFNRGKYDKAIEKFRFIKENYYPNKYAVESEIKVGDSYFLDGEYTLAQVVYDEFRKMHPAHPLAPYVIYQSGVCRLKEALSIDRDQAQVESALGDFEYILTNFPESRYFRLALEKAKECKKMLAERELYIARFYLKKGKNLAALGRFQTILEKYSGLGFDEIARKNIEQLKPKIEKEKVELQKEMEKKQKND